MALPLATTPGASGTAENLEDPDLQSKNPFWAGEIGEVEENYMGLEKGRSHEAIPHGVKVLGKFGLADV